MLLLLIPPCSCPEVMPRREFNSANYGLTRFQASAGVRKRQESLYPSLTTVPERGSASLVCCGLVLWAVRRRISRRLA